MKLSTLLATTAIASAVTISTIPLQAFSPNLGQVAAQEIKVAAVTAQQKIDQIIAVKGKPGSAALMRKLYEKDLTPIGIQPGGAGMVVNLYSKKDDTTLSLCTTFDVVVAVKKGAIAQFDPGEVK
ncbi:hypothetical protein [Pseudanabaena sp. PCC 6802]|uniref:hypothetical protein n=1 Tax=Pseudanabaena sp. PCC 6802 TaxID=118173 RepID=UPI000346C3BA|nr:hypothetical protein [Pseudanabaena sp. PCC 6802]